MRSNKLLTILLAIAIIALAVCARYLSSNTISHVYQIDSGSLISGKFGYRFVLPSGWHVPMPFSACEDTDVRTGRHNCLNSNIETTVKNWNPNDAEAVVLTDLSVPEETAFNDKVNKGQTNIYDFPGNIISIVALNATSTMDVTEINTATSSLKRITTKNGYTGFSYHREMQQSREADVISVMFPSKGVLSGGKIANRITILYSGKTTAMSTVLDLANSISSL